MVACRHLLRWITGSLIYSATSASSHIHRTMRHGRGVLGRSPVSSSSILLTNATAIEGLTGLIPVGTPGQFLDFQFDTTFDGTLLGSVSRGSGLGYKSNLSSSFVPVPGLSEYIFVDTSYDTPLLDTLLLKTANDTFTIGGTPYPGITFGLLADIGLWSSGARGIIGLDRHSHFLHEIRDQLTDWVCALDINRLWNNGTWTLGAVTASGDIAWAGILSDDTGLPWWYLNVTAISAGNRKSPDLTWTAMVASAEQSLVWPQSLLDWYFEAIPSSTWSAENQTYRYPCGVALPDFVFSIGDGTFTIPGTYLPYQRDETGTTCITLITGDNSTESNINGYSFGSWWAELGILVLDYEKHRVGFANKSTPLPAFGTSSLISFQQSS